MMPIPVTANLHAMAESEPPEKDGDVGVVTKTKPKTAKPPLYQGAVAQ